VQLYDYLYSELRIPASAKYAQAVMGAVITYAKGRRYIIKRPELPKSFKQQLIKANQPRERTYTNAEISAHFNFVKEKLSNHVHQAYIKTLYYLAQRRTETLHMKWTDYDRSQQTIKLPAALTKNNVAHILPIGEELAQVLANLWEYTGHTDYLFSNLSTNQPFEPTLLINQFKDEFGEFQPHDIRRTVSTNLAALSVNSDVIDRILNHTPDKLRRTYNRHSYLPQMREALGIWEHELKKITQHK
jgi:integrase